MTEPKFNTKTYQCPYCKVIIDGAYIEINSFQEIHCPSCNTMIQIEGQINKEQVIPDKRTDKRCEVSLKVSYKSFNEFIEEYTRNVSRRGMFIHTKRPHAIGETAEIMLHVPGLNKPIKIIGQIRHVTTDTQREEDQGIGLQFIDIDEESRQALIQFIISQDGCI